MALPRASLRLLIVILSFGIVACGSTTYGVGAPATITATIPADCGTISSLPKGTIVDSGALTAAHCFGNAFKVCQTSTLKFTEAGIDNGSIHQMSIVKTAKGCVVQDAISTYIAPSPPKPLMAQTCTKVDSNAQGISISGCDDGQTIDIVVSAS